MPRPTPAKTQAPTPDNPMPFQPLDSLRVTTPAQLRAISDPLRVDMLELISDEARTVKQIADQLGKPATKLYYHMNALEAAGFVKVVETRVKSGIIEKYYRAAAQSLSVDRSLLTKRGFQAEALDILLTSVFDATADDLQRSYAAGLIRLPTKKNATGNLIIGRSLLTLRKDDLPKFIAKFNALLDELKATPVAADSVHYACTVAFFPRSARATHAESKSKQKARRKSP